ncbi:MAG: InlB B-repeat-containing protein, partial [Lachnospiraceae bacterium]|nr:InlB B-repeat-containing protein [Lachnospiraceae bacterium]
ITATAGANGKVSPESKTVNEGEDATFTITPDTGYEIDTVTVDGAAVTPTSDTTYKFTDVRAEHTLNVTFKETIEHVTGVTLDKISLTLTEGTTETLTATVTPFKAANKNVTWKSGDETVATIDAGGMVTAVAEGTTNITVTTEDGGYTAECNITVNAAPPVPEIKYTVTFDSDGGSDISSQTVKSGEKAIKPYNPTKSNYRFDYWYTGSATTKAYDFETPVTSDITLKAHWTYSGGSHSGGGSSGGGSTTANRTSTKYPVNTAVTPVTTSSDGKTQLMGTAIIGMRWDSLPTGVMPTAGTWSLGRDGYSYLKNNGQKAINEWDYIVLKTGYGSLFYFDENGIMVTGWKQIGGKWYFFNYENNDYLGALMVGPGKSLDGYSLSADGSWTGY